MCRCDLTRQTAENTARIANKESNMVDQFQNAEQRLRAYAFEQANNCQHFEDEFLSVLEGAEVLYDWITTGCRPVSDIAIEREYHRVKLREAERKHQDRSSPASSNSTPKM